MTGSSIAVAAAAALVVVVVAAVSVAVESAFAEDEVVLDGNRRRSDAFERHTCEQENDVFSSDRARVLVLSLNDNCRCRVCTLSRNLGVHE